MQNWNGDDDLPPSGFLLQHDAVPLPLWEEIRAWLGLDWNDFHLGLMNNNNDRKNKAASPSLPQQQGDRSCTPSERNSEMMTPPTSSTPTSTSPIIPWEWSPSSQARAVAQFGFRYDYENDTVDIVTPTPAIPPLLRRLLLLHQQQQQQHDVERFTQCIINAYGPNQDSHIPWHVDDPAFGPVILVYTFGEARPLLLRRKLTTTMCNNGGDFHDDDGTAAVAHHHHHRQVVPRHGSCYILSGEVRDSWEHCVPTGSDCRISITFRSARNLESSSS